MVLFIFNVFLSNGAYASFSEKAFWYNGKFLSYFANQDLSNVNSSLTQAIIVVHGSEGNASTYFHTIQSLTQSLGEENKTLVIAPHFKTPSHQTELLPNELLWTDEGWLQGDEAILGGGGSSFEVMDALIKTITNRNLFPELQKLTLTGHSAGGQFTQRFAVASEVDQELNNIEFHYLVLNPGSYLYLNGDRPIHTPQLKFAIPESSNCEYNNFKYGFKHLNSYFQKNPIPTMVSHYLDRRVTYLLGAEDKNTDPKEVDQDCPAQLQGDFRYERGLNFKAYLDNEFPTHIHQLISVPHVGHTEYGMYTSTEGRGALFKK